MRGGRVSSRARLREDRAGDPLDGLVNLFDLGVVLAVAFLLAALSSIDLSPSALKENRAATEAPARQAPAQDDAVVVGPDEQARELRLKPGERVVGSGKPVGTVYRLEDGRTILVRPKDEGGADGSGGTDAGASGGDAGGAGTSAGASGGDAGGAGTAGSSGASGAAGAGTADSSGAGGGAGSATSGAADGPGG